MFNTKYSTISSTPPRSSSIGLSFYLGVMLFALLIPFGALASDDSDDNDVKACKGQLLLYQGDRDRSNPGGVVVIDTKTKTVVQTLDGFEERVYAVDFSRNKKHVYVTERHPQNDLKVFDQKTGALVQDVDLNATPRADGMPRQLTIKDPEGIVVAPNGEIWITNFQNPVTGGAGKSAILILDPSNFKVLDEIELPTTTHNSLLTDDGKFVLIGGLKFNLLEPIDDGEYNRIFVYDVNSKTLVKEFIIREELITAGFGSGDPDDYADSDAVNTAVYRTFDTTNKADGSTDKIYMTFGTPPGYNELPFVPGQPLIYPGFAEIDFDTGAVRIITYPTDFNSAVWDEPDETGQTHGLAVSPDETLLASNSRIANGTFLYDLPLGTDPMPTYILASSTVDVDNNGTPDDPSDDTATVIPGSPHWLNFDPNGKFLYNSNANLGVDVIDVAKQSVVVDIPLANIFKDALARDTNYYGAHNLLCLG